MTRSSADSSKYAYCFTVIKIFPLYNKNSIIGFESFKYRASDPLESLFLMQGFPNLANCAIIKILSGFLEFKIYTYGLHEF